MAPDASAVDLVTTLAHRRAVLECVLEGPTDRQTLAADLDHSWSTVDRGCHDLAEQGLVDLVPDGVTPTLLASLVWETYHTFEQYIAAIKTPEDDTAPLWATDTERRDVMQLVADRLDVLECIETTTFDKRGLVDDLDASRSTVDRAIRELEVGGLVDWIDDGYTTTQAGRQATEQYRTTVATVSDILAAQTVVEELPYDCPLQPALFVDATVERADAVLPYYLPDGVRTRIEAADRVRLFLPVLATPQLLDCCQRAVVQAGLPLEVLTSPDLFETLTAEFPGPLAAMAATSSCTVLVTDTDTTPTSQSQLGLVLADIDGSTTVSVIVYGDQQTVQGTLHNDSTNASQWAKEYYTQMREGASDVTTDLRALDTTGMTPTSAGLSGVNDTERVAHEAEGFVQLTPDYFAQRAPAPPATAWRAGFDIVDVHAGYAIDREIERDGTCQSLTDALIEDLGEGADHALLGQPGSGKSTVGRAVACRWYEQGRGAVFYRKSGTGTTFDSPAILSAQLRETGTEGHTLVVVEDAMRAEANTIFRVMRDFREDASVTFLVDTRTDEWTDPPAFPTDARLEAYRTEAVETVTMPPFNESTAERLVQQFQTTTNHEINVSLTHLFREIGSHEDDISERPADRADDLLLLLHQLTLHVTPLTFESASIPTTLAESVQQTYEELRDAEDMVLDVGVLVNLLNATGVGVQPALVYALADDETEIDAIDAALSILEGSIIFKRENSTDDASYRTVHEAWSELFLEQLLTASDTDRAASQRFGRCVSAVLSLADDTDRRDRSTAAVPGNTPTIDRIDSTPTEWADATTERFYQLGMSYPKLAPLFGTTNRATIELPPVCSPEMGPQCAQWRGRMYYKGGDPTRAKDELEQAIALVETTEANTETLTAVKARSCRYLAGIVYARGEIDTAKQFAAQALASYRAIGDRLGEADCYRNQGMAARREGDFDRAQAWCERSLAIYRDLGVTGKKRANVFKNLGRITALRGNLAQAEETLERSLALDTGSGDVRMTTAYVDLGEVLQWRGDLDRAENYCKRGLAIARTAGNPPGEAHGCFVLGQIALDRGDHDQATEYVQRSLDIWQQIGDPWGKAMGRRCLGRLARMNSDNTVAEDHLTDALTRCRTLAYRRGEATTLFELGELARDRDRPEQAREHFAAAVEIYREMGAVRDAVETLERLAETYETSNEYETARTHYEAAVTLAQEAEFDVPHAAITDTAPEESSNESR